MNRLTKGSVGLAAGLALSLTGVAGASATEPERHEPSKPVVGPWEPYDDKYDIEKGWACKGEIKAHSKGQVRITQLYVDEKTGKEKLEVEFKDWSYSTYSHTRVVKKVVKHGDKKKVVKKKVTRTVKVNEGGDAVIKANHKTGVAIGHHEGENTFWGKGVYGLVHTRGYVKTKFTNFQTPDESLSILKAKHAVELCKKLGTKPVWGKNPPTAEPPSDMSTAAARGPA